MPGIIYLFYAGLIYAFQFKGIIPIILINSISQQNPFNIKSNLHKTLGYTYLYTLT